MCSPIPQVPPPQNEAQRPWGIAQILYFYWVHGAFVTHTLFFLSRMVLAWWWQKWGSAPQNEGEPLNVTSKSIPAIKHPPLIKELPIKPPELKISQIQPQRSPVNSLK